MLTGNRLEQFGSKSVSKFCQKSEYDQKIPRSQTEDNPMAPRGRAPQLSRDTRKQIKQSNQLSLRHQDDCKTRIVKKPGLKAPEQSNTQIDSSPLVSNSLIQIGLTFQPFIRPSVYSNIRHLLASFFYSTWLATST